MKIKVITSILAIIALVAMITGGTMAWFSDQEEVKGNTFAAGSIDLVISDPGNPTAGVVPFSLGDLKPGDSGQKIITLTNNGTIDGNLDLAFTNHTELENTLTEPEMQQYPMTHPDGSVTLSTADYDGNGGELGMFLQFSVFIDLDHSGTFTAGDIQLAYGGNHQVDGYRGVGVEYPSAIGSMLTPWTSVVPVTAGDSVDLVINWQFPTESTDLNYSQNMAMTDSMGFDIQAILNQVQTELP